MPAGLLASGEHYALEVAGDSMIEAGIMDSKRVTSAARIRQLAAAIRAVKDKVKFCSICFNVSEQETCNICRDQRRDAGAEPRLRLVHRAAQVLGLEAVEDLPDDALLYLLQSRYCPSDKMEAKALEIVTIEQLREYTAV